MIPVGGGGLIAGVAAAVKKINKNILIIVRIMGYSKFICIHNIFYHC